MKWIGALALMVAFVSLRSQAQTLDQRESLWRNEIARYCGKYPAKENCDDGDSVIFNGLLCMSGEEAGCEAVRDSQGFDGQWWRSPRRNPGNLGEKASFSRDQTLGVLLYLAKTRDVGAAIRWMDWIDQHRVCSIKNPLTGACVITLYKVCVDDRGESCTMTPALWGLVKKVWDHLGLNPTAQMRKYENADVSDLELIAADREEPGYKLHLKAVSSFLRISIGESVSRSRDIARKLYARQAMNPFFQVLAEGTEGNLVEKLMQLCPSDSREFPRHQWAWERDQAQEAWRESMGWDCIFMVNLVRNMGRDMVEGL